MNLANALTFLRVFLVPVFGWLLWQDWDRRVTLAVFLLAALTDLLDGWYARKFQSETNFGKIADPIADKALTGVAWIGLSLFGPIPWLATILILVREVGITVWRLVSIKRVVLAADTAGKWNTTLQIVCISAFLIAPDMRGYIGLALFALLWWTVWITVQTGFRYLPVLAAASRQDD